MNLAEILFLLIFVVYFICLPFLFEKAGEAKWKGLVPVYHFLVLLKLIERPWWWLLLLFVPGVNLIMFIIMNVELAKAFNRRSTKLQWAAGAIPWVYLPYMTFKDEEAKYVGPVDWSTRKKSTAREWGEAIVFAVVAATVIRTFFIEAYTIPTPSMEKSMLVGDYLFVSKTSYGPRLPLTPVAFPFAHHTMPLMNTKAYVEWFKLPYFRLPGLGDVDRGDAVVFNFPHGDTVIAHPNLQGFDYYYYLRSEAIIEAGGMENFILDKPKYLAEARTKIIDKQECESCASRIGRRGKTGGIMVRPMDKKENYIKRCVGLPGDELEIKYGQVHIDGQPMDNPENLEFMYYLVPNFRVVTDEKKARIREILDLPLKDDLEVYGGENPYFVCNLTQEQKEKAESLSYITRVVSAIDSTKKVDARLAVFPNDENYDWTANNFGPINIPAEGETMDINIENLPIYERIISVYEGNELSVSGNDIFINGEKTDKYTFKMNYYWLMGDNRHNSLDSRFWGFVPEDHVVGRAIFTWFSKQNVNDHTESRIRWERMFRTVD